MFGLLKRKPKSIEISMDSDLREKGKYQDIGSLTIDGKPVIGWVHSVKVFSKATQRELSLHNRAIFVFRCVNGNLIRLSGDRDRRKNGPDHSNNMYNIPIVLDIDFPEVENLVDWIRDKANHITLENNIGSFQAGLLIEASVIKRSKSASDKRVDSILARLTDARWNTLSDEELKAQGF